MMAPTGIFIVEDSFIVSLHLQKTLEGEGYHILGTSDSGEEALAQIADLKPDLVLMDIMLSGKMDGVQVATKIKEELGIPVVYITALTNKETIQRAKITEPYGYLTKPFEDRDIFTVIEMALYKSGIEKKLRQSEEKFFSTLRSISDGVVTIDKTYTITYANPSAESMIGITLQKLLGNNIFDVLQLKNSDTSDFPVNPLQCSIETGQRHGWPGNLLLQARNGREIPVVDGTVSPIIDSKDQSIGLVLTFKDGTDKFERQRLERQVERQRLLALIEGQERERTRIAKDLHDGLGQMLNAIKMNAGHIITDDLKRKDLFTLLDEAITETKRISDNLLPSRLRDFDLPTCLQSLCAQVQSGTDAIITFSSFLDEHTISETMKINLYRIAQEALNNAVRHSHANHISLQLNEDDEFLRLTVEDDGRGLENYKDSCGNGLINMNDRAKILNGTFTVESDNIRGTLIIVEVPK